MYYKYSKLFKQDSVEKQIIIEYDGGTITNNELYSESFELTESLCSESQLKFGSCEAGVIKFKIANIMKPLKGKWLTVSMIIGGKADAPFKIGKYKVFSDSPSADRNYRDVTAYDAMYDIINADITSFYNGAVAESSLAINTIMSLLQNLEIPYKETISNLPNWYVASDSTAESLSGKDLISAFCELNGCFARIDRDGKFEFVKLGDVVNPLYPEEYLFPADDLYPTTGDESGLSEYGFDGCYKIEDGYLYTKIRGQTIIRDSEGIETELYGVSYYDNYDIRISVPENSNRLCILMGSGSYLDKDGVRFYAPYFYWIDEYLMIKSNPSLTMEVDIDKNGSFSMSGVLFCRFYEQESDGGKYGLRYIPNIPVFDVYDYLRSYLNIGDLDGCVNYNGFNDIEKSDYISCKYEDFTVKNIGSILIRNSENEAGALAGRQGGNCYIIEDNFLAHGKSYDDLKYIADNLYNSVRNISYIPFEAETIGKPYLQVGERVRIKAKNKTIESYILKRTLKGIQALRDTYSAAGEECYSQAVNSVGQSIIQLKMKTNILERNVEETKSAIYDEETGLQTQITQNAEQIDLLVQDVYDTDGSGARISRIQQNADAIDLKVSKGDVSAQISLEKGNVTIKGNRLIVESDNFSLDGTGMAQVTGVLKTAANNGTVAALDSGSLYFSIDNNQIGSLATAAVDDSKTGLTINTSQKFLSLGVGSQTAATGYYFLNYGLNPNGITRRHYFEDSIYSTKYVLAERFYCDELNGYIFGAGTTDADARLKASGNFSVHGDFVCAGTKNRAVKTENYGTVLMNALESTGAYFTDIGSGKITDSVCYVYFDPKFVETIDKEHEYQVFLTNTSKEKTDYVEKCKGHFVVHGEDGATFDWMIVAKQKEYQNIRMESDIEDKEQEIDYDETLFDENEIPVWQSQEYMEEFSDNIDESAIAYVNSIAEMENEQFVFYKES